MHHSLLNFKIKKLVDFQFRRMNLRVYYFMLTATSKQDKSSPGTTEVD